MQRVSARESRRTAELQRQERIFNTKVRTIGIDKEALDYQVKERRSKKEQDAEELKQYANDLIHSDHTACLLERKQKKDERLLEEAIMRFRQEFQQPTSRREFDLNDPEFLKKQEGVQILPGLVGEDPTSKERVRRQREQLRNWSLQQQQELEQATELQKHEDQHYDQSRVALDCRALELQKMEKESQRITKIAVKDFNRALAAGVMEQRQKERREEEENNQTDILNQLQGALLSENSDQTSKLLGASRGRRDCYKGITPEQRLHYTNYQLQQAEDKRRVHMEEKEEELQFDRLRLTSARAALLLERQQARANKELRRAMDRTNTQLAQAQKAQKNYLDKEFYSSVPDDSYFSQFNTCRLWRFTGDRPCSLCIKAANGSTQP